MAPANVLETSQTDRQLLLFDDLRQAERRAVSSRVASVVAHLIGTPLHVIAGRAALIRSAPDDPGVVENARRIEAQVDRLARRIRALIDYLTAPEPNPLPESAESVLASALALYVPVARERGVTLETTGSALQEASVDGTSALIVLTSLLSLATRVTPRGETCVLRHSGAADGHLLLEIDVPGLIVPESRLDTLEPPDHMENTSVEQLQVLSVSSVIARRAGGNIEVLPGEPGRATIRYTLALLS